MDQRKKSKIPIQPKESVRWLLKNATGSQLDFMKRIAGGDDFKDFINLIAKFRDFQVYNVFEFVAETDRDLVVHRAYRRGAVNSLTDFIIACQAAKEEISRRKKNKDE